MNKSLDSIVVDSRVAFSRFVELLLQDLQAAPGEWENNSLLDFLTAMQAYAEDIQGYYDNTDQDIDADKPSWQTFADILRGARVYE